MTDLINRVNSLHVDVINTLLEKYRPVLKEIKFKSQEDIPYMAYVLNLTVNYVNQKHKEETSDWKTWCGVLIKRLFEREIVKTKEDIFKHIDLFLEYKKKEYKKYVENIALYSDEYHRDNPFVEQYIKQLSL